MWNWPTSTSHGAKKKTGGGHGFDRCVWWPRAPWLFAEKMWGWDPIYDILGDCFIRPWHKNPLLTNQDDPWNACRSRVTGSRCSGVVWLMKPVREVMGLLEVTVVKFGCPRHPKSSKYLVSRCLEPLKAFSGDVWGFEHLLTRCLDV